MNEARTRAQPLLLGGAEALQARVSGSGAFLIMLPLCWDCSHGVDLAAGRETTEPNPGAGSASQARHHYYDPDVIFWSGTGL